MDFVPGLISGGVPEFAVDGLGKIEIFVGRVRLTLYRVVEIEGKQTYEAACSLVWSARGWRSSRDNFMKARDMSDAAIVTDIVPQRVGQH